MIVLYSYASLQIRKPKRRTLSINIVSLKTLFGKSNPMPEEPAPTVNILTESKLSLVRKYFFEVVLIGLCFIVYKLNASNQQIEMDMKKYLLEDRSEMIKVVVENTRVMRYYTPPPVDTLKQ